MFLLLSVVVTTKYLLIDLTRPTTSSTNMFLSWSNYSMEVTSCMNHGRTTQRNFLTTEMSSTLPPNEQMPMTIVVKFMEKSFIGSSSFIQIALNSLFKICTFTSLTRPHLYALFAAFPTLPFSSPSLLT